MLEFARGLPAIRKTIDEHMSLRGLPREKVLATVVHLLENDPDPRRQRRLCQAEQELRPDHAARSACEGGGRRAALPVQGQERQDLEAAGRRTGASPKSSRPARTCRARTCSSISDDDGEQLVDHLGGRERLSAGDHRARHHRQGFPHLGRHRAGGAGPVGVRGLRQPGEGQEEHPRGHRAGRRRASATRRRICRKCYVHPEVLACYLDGGLLLDIKQRIETQLREDLPPSSPRRRPS